MIALLLQYGVIAQYVADIKGNSLYNKKQEEARAQPCCVEERQGCEEQKQEQLRLLCCACACVVVCVCVVAARDLSRSVRSYYRALYYTCTVFYIKLTNKVESSIV
jgi:hypothetical protein